MDRVIEAFEQWWAKQEFPHNAIPHMVGISAWGAAFAAGVKHEQMALEEREAAVCPEDRSFEETVKALRDEVARLKRTCAVSEKH